MVRIVYSICVIAAFKIVSSEQRTVVPRLFDLVIEHIIPQLEMHEYALDFITTTQNSEFPVELRQRVLEHYRKELPSGLKRVQTQLAQEALVKHLFRYTKTDGIPECCSRCKIANCFAREVSTLSFEQMILANICIKYRDQSPLILNLLRQSSELQSIYDSSPPMIQSVMQRCIFGNHDQHGGRHCCIII